MSTPDALDWRDVHTQVALQYLCCGCGKPLLDAFESAGCCHRVCNACREKGGDENTFACPACDAQRQWQYSETLSTQVKASLRELLLERGIAATSDRFPALSMDACQHYAERFLNVQEAQLNMQRLTEELQHAEEQLSNSANLHDVDGSAARLDYTQVAMCQLHDELLMVPNKAEVKRLTVKGDWMTSIDMLKEFVNVQVLTLSSCARLLHLCGIEAFSQLRHLTVEDCDIVEGWGIEASSSLQEVTFKRCTGLVGLVLPGDVDQAPQVQDNKTFPQEKQQQQQQRGLRSLSVVDCPLFEFVTLTSNSSTLRRCSLANTAVRDLRFLESCTALTHFDLHGCTRLTDLTPVRKLIQLTSIDVSDAVAIANPLATFFRLTQLEEVRVNGCNVPDGLLPFAELPELRIVEARNTAIAHIDGLSGCAKLEVVDVSSCAYLSNANALSNKSCLRVVRASATALESVGSINSFGTLEEVDLRNCTRIANLQEWANFDRAKRLTTLLLGGCSISSIATWLKSPSNLEKFDVSYTQVGNVGVLENSIGSLKELHLEESKVKKLDVLKGTSRPVKVFVRGTPMKNVSGLPVTVEVIWE